MRVWNNGTCLHYTRCNSYEKATPCNLSRGPHLRTMGGATMTIDQDRQAIRHRATALCQHAAVLLRDMRRQRTALKCQRAWLNARYSPLHALLRQQRSLRRACSSTPGGEKHHKEIRGLTNILSHLRRP